MSGRFGRLEFDDDRAHQRARQEESLLEGTPIRTAAHFRELAVRAERSGRFETALQQYTRCLREDRTVITAWVGQIRMLVQLGECAEARLWADKALELFRGNGDLLAAKAQAALRDGERITAMASSDASLRSPGSSPWRWEARGEVLLARGRRLFRDCFQKALAEPAADWFDRLILAGILLYHGRPAAALDHAQQAVRLEPGHGYGWLVVARCQAATGFADAAVESCRHCLELDPDLHDAAQLMAEAGRHGPFTRLWRRVRGRRR